MRTFGLLLLVGASCLGAVSCGSTRGKSDADQMPAAMGSERIQSLLGAARLQEEAWRIDLSRLAGEPTFDRMLQVEDGILYVQDDDHAIHAIDQAAGTHNWLVSFQGPLSHPLSVGGNACVMVSEDQLVAVDRHTGARTIGANLLSLDGWPACNATEAGGELFVGMQASKGVRAILPTSGQNGWLYATRGLPAQLISYSSGPTNNVLCVTDDGLLVALPPWPAGGKAPGSEVWYRRIPGARVGTPLAVQDGRAWFACDNGFAYCMKLTTGDILWRCALEVPFEDGPKPLVAGGQAFLGTGDRIYVIDAETGELQWHADAQRAITKIGDLCYLQRDGAVQVVRASDGAEISSFDLGGLTFPSVPGGGLLIAADGAGHLFALN